MSSSETEIHKSIRNESKKRSIEEQLETLQEEEDEEEKKTGRESKKQKPDDDNSDDDGATSTSTSTSSTMTTTTKSDENDIIYNIVQHPLFIPLLSQDPTFKSLSVSQRQAYVAAVIQRKNVCMLGAGGCGKSHVFKIIYRAFANGNVKVYKTATTGIASINMGGTTLHSLLGIGIGQDSLEHLIIKVNSDRYLIQLYQEMEVLMIDEIGMLSPLYASKIEQLFRRIRGNDKPFGGVQIICSGDFFQLPPVLDSDENESIENQFRFTPSSSRSSSSSSSTTSSDKVEFIFELKMWNQVIHEIIELETIFRQTKKEDIELLNRARVGKLLPEDWVKLESRVNAPILNKPDHIQPVKMRSWNREVKKINEESSAKITSQAYEFFSTQGYELYNGHKISYKKSGTSAPSAAGLSYRQKRLIEELSKECGCPAYQKLKVGMQVMLVANVDVASGLGNGSTGVITKIELNEDLYRREHITEYIPYVHFENKWEPIPVRKFLFILPDGLSGHAYTLRLPLVVSFSSTIHKNQGKTVQYVEGKLDRTIFAPGQAYTLISRAPSIDNITLVGNIDRDCFKVHPKVVKYYEILKRKKMQALLKQVK